MELNEDEKSYAVLHMKMRIIGGFAFCLIFSIIFLVIMIVLAATGRGNVAVLFIAPFVVCVLTGIGLGIFIYRRRNKKQPKVEENNKDKPTEKE